MPSTAQPAPETDEKKSRGLGSYVVWAFVAVMVYVLSLGPVMRLQKAGILSRRAEDAIGVIYRPISYLVGNTPLWKPLGMYLHLWRPDLWNPKGEAIRPSGLL